MRFRALTKFTQILAGNADATGQHRSPIHYNLASKNVLGYLSRIVLSAGPIEAIVAISASDLRNIRFLCVSSGRIMFRGLISLCRLGPRRSTIATAFLAAARAQRTPLVLRDVPVTPVQLPPICPVSPLCQPCRPFSTRTGILYQVDEAFPKLPPMVAPKAPEYPPVERDETEVEELFGEKVFDPYRALENPSDKALDKFVQAQNAVTDKYLDDHAPFRGKLKDKLTKIWNYEKYGCPGKHGEFYYYQYNAGLQRQPVMYAKKDLKAEDKGEVFFDANTLSDDGTVALSAYSWSETGNYFAYALSESGSDWTNIRLKSTPQVTDPSQTVKADDSETIKWCKFTSPTWTHDDRGFFYQRYPEPGDDADPGRENSKNKQHMTYYHVRGTEQKEDTHVFTPENPEHVAGSVVTQCGKYLVITVHQGTALMNEVYILPLEVDKSFKGNVKVTTVVKGFEALYDYITNDEQVFYFMTNKNASRCRIVKYDMKNPSAGFVEVVPEQEGVLEHVVVSRNNVFVMSYLINVTNKISMFNFQSSNAKLEWLNTGEEDKMMIAELDSQRKDDHFLFRAISFENPGIIYQYKFSDQTSTKGELSVVKKTQLSMKLDRPTVVEQKWYKSKDGTKVPMFIFRPKDMKPEKGSKVPCLLYGYGGFGISLSPRFSVSWNTWVHSFNGIVVVANIRGGGEFGEEEWHLAGTKGNKQHVFDDFIYASKALEDMGYTTAPHIASMGGSNGGLLVAATANQAPDRFGAVICQVGVLDMLRFQKFTIGYLWISDFGDPDTEEGFRYLYKYSPYHNIPEGEGVKYPPILLTTADHDDRVAPLHSFKFISQLQYKRGKIDSAPHLIRIEAKVRMGRVDILEEFEELG